MPKKSPLQGQNILLVGAGKMGSALLDGWLGAGIAPTQFNVLEPSPSFALNALGVNIGAPSAPSDIVVLAIKPQLVDAVVPSLRPHIKDETMVLSILAGASVERLGVALSEDDKPHECAFVRAMPNTPAAIGQGITALYAGGDVSEQQRGFAETLMQAVGQTLWVKEEVLIDAATAISGSGPAYIFYLAEVLSANGMRLGLPKEVAQALAYQTIIGAGQMIATGDTPTALRESVTSPGGTTEAALESLVVELPDLMKKVTAAAFARAKELSQG